MGNTSRKLVEVAGVVGWFVGIGPLQLICQSHPGARPFLVMWLLAGPLIAVAVIVKRFIGNFRGGYDDGMKKLRLQLGQCVACGYDLTNNASGLCPECGKPMLEKTHAST